jgi:hypothetical protein
MGGGGGDVNPVRGLPFISMAELYVGLGQKYIIQTKHK